jgi:hypothetical protein
MTDEGTRCLPGVLLMAWAVATAAAGLVAASGGGILTAVAVYSVGGSAIVAVWAGLTVLGEGLERRRVAGAPRLRASSR